MNVDSSESLLTKAAAAERLGGVSISFINQLLARGKLAKVRLGYRLTRIPAKSVEEFIRKRTIVEAGK